MFNKYPYTDFHELNLDWVLAKIKELTKEMADFVAINEIQLKGIWNITKQYPLWSVVTVGNTGYLSIQIVPAGIDIDNEDYWMKIFEMPDVSHRKFILIGDSLGYGVVGSGSPRGTGWMEGFRLAYGEDNVIYQEHPESLVGVAGFCSTLPFLDLLKSIEEDYVFLHEEITDIVVLGGSNDLGVSASYSDLDAAVKAFCEYARIKFPSARIAIGCLYRRILDATLAGIDYGYETCKKYGAEYIHDTQALCCLPSYYAPDGTHITAVGYDFYQPYINQAILTGHCNFNFEYVSDAAFNAGEVSPGHAIQVRYNITQDTYKIAFSDKTTNNAYPFLLINNAHGNDQNIQDFITVTNPLEIPGRYKAISSYESFSRANGDNTVLSTARKGFLYLRTLGTFNLASCVNVTDLSGTRQQLFFVDPAACIPVSY